VDATKRAQRAEQAGPWPSLRLDGERPVYNNAQAITSLGRPRGSALGQKFVELNPGDPSTGLLPADKGGTAGAHGRRARRSPTVLAVLDEPHPAGDRLVRPQRSVAGSRGTVRTSTWPPPSFPDVLAGPRHRVGPRSPTTAARRHTAALLRSTSELSQSFAGRQEQIGQLLGQARPDVRRLQRRQTALRSPTSCGPRPDSLRARPRAALGVPGRPAGHHRGGRPRAAPGWRVARQGRPRTSGASWTTAGRRLDKVPGVVRRRRRGPVDDLKGTFDDAHPPWPSDADRRVRSGRPR